MRINVRYIGGYATADIFTTENHTTRNTKDWYCTHEDTEIVPPCCSERGSSGYIECGCGGEWFIICDNPDCDGVSDEEFDELMERIPHTTAGHARLHLIEQLY